jgi:DNA helicase HerA-like ATPase
MNDTSLTSSLLGVVDGSTNATTRNFRLVLDENATVQLDDLVVCRQQLPDGREVAHYGIVVEQGGTIEGAEEPSDTHLIASEKTMPGLTSRVADVLVLRSDPELWLAPLPGAEVLAAHGEERKLALFVDQMEQQLPVGLDQSGQPVYADFSYMNGEQGGHVSISGISGVAAKTSYALHLLYTILETERGRALLGTGATEARAIAFNVKGEDLLHLDKPNRKFTDEERVRWALLGVEEPQPFRSVRFYAPPVPGGGDQLVAQTATRPDARVYGWTPEAFIREGLLRFCFTDGDDRQTQVGFVEQVVRAELARHAYPLEGEEGAIVLCDDPQTASHTFERVVSRRPEPRAAGSGTPIRDYQDLLDFLISKLELELDDPHGGSWAGRTQAGTVLAFLRRLMALSPRLGQLIRTGVEQVELDTSLTVVDIHALHESAQRFVVGALVARIFDQKQGTGREPLRFVMLDELNKYAPRQGRSPLKELFVDIAERGRSLGVLLVGCQQAASSVAEPVVRQPALKVCGRLDAGESADYRFLTLELRERATRFLPGTMVLDQPLVPAPLPIRFPFPPYATNSSDRRPSEGDLAEREAAFENLK